MNSNMNWRKVAIALPAFAILGLLILPLLAVIPMSFSSSMVYSLVPSDPSLVQYRTFFSSQIWLTAIGNSFKVAAGTAVCTTILGVAAAFGLTQVGSRMRSMLQGLFVLPQAVPSIVVATALYFSFSNMGLQGSLIGMVVAHSAMSLPFVVMIVGGAIYNLDPYLSEASRSLGSSSIRTFLRVTLPQISMGVMGGAVFAFHYSFDEVVIALFLSGARTKTLPVKIWDGIFYEVSPILPAISTILIVAPLVLFILIMFVLNRRRTRFVTGTKI